jgi:methylated-DNA-protein-cysteine methyltransferase-like protein
MCRKPACCASVGKFSMKRSKKKADPIGAMRIDIESVIRKIPRGKVSTYGGVARMAGYGGAARMVARILRRGFGLPWQRVLGAGGQIKLTGDSAIEQRLRLEAECVLFRGRRVDMKSCEWKGALSNHAQARRTKRSATRKR